MGTGSKGKSAIGCEPIRFSWLAISRPPVPRERNGRQGRSRALRRAGLFYVDVIVRRYDAATGNPAVLVETGETFDLLAARRSREAAPV
jgi:hypothetical protein